MWSMIQPKSSLCLARLWLLTLENTLSIILSRMKSYTIQPKGFTLVELLIVIVVIGILAAITLVAYNGVQAKAQDSARNSAIAQIQKAIVAYQAEFGYYPSVSPATGTNVPSGFSGAMGSSNSYTYSVDTAGKWLYQLTQTPDGSTPLLSNVPVDPVNDTSHYFIYFASGPSGVSPVCTQPFYILIAYGYASQSDIPPTSHDVNCTDGTIHANWQPNSVMGVFSNISGQ